MLELKLKAKLWKKNCSPDEALWAKCPLFFQTLTLPPVHLFCFFFKFCHTCTTVFGLNRTNSSRQKKKKQKLFKKTSTDDVCNEQRSLGERYWQTKPENQAKDEKHQNGAVLTKETKIVSWQGLLRIRRYLSGTICSDFEMSTGDGASGFMDTTGEAICPAAMSCRRRMTSCCQPGIFCASVCRRMCLVR